MNRFQEVGSDVRRRDPMVGQDLLVGDLRALRAAILFRNAPGPVARGLALLRSGLP
jgi:hypothetical protein